MAVAKATQCSCTGSTCGLYCDAQTQEDNIAYAVCAAMQTQEDAAAHAVCAAMRMQDKAAAHALIAAMQT